MNNLLKNLGPILILVGVVILAVYFFLPVELKQLSYICRSLDGSGIHCPYFSEQKNKIIFLFENNKSRYNIVPALCFCPLSHRSKQCQLPVYIINNPVWSTISSGKTESFTFTSLLPFPSCFQPVVQQLLFHFLLRSKQLPWSIFIWIVIAARIVWVFRFRRMQNLQRFKLVDGFTSKVVNRLPLAFRLLTPINSSASTINASR